MIGEFAGLPGAADVDAAVEAAKAAFPAWSLMPAPKRGEILFKVARLLAEHKEELSRLMTREMGKVLPEARGDVQEAIDVAYYMAGEGRRLFGQTVPSEMPDKFAMAIRRPIGVVGIITPWNFPVAIPGWKLFPGADLRQHGGHQAGLGHAGLPGALRRAAARGWHPDRRGQRGDRQRRRGGQPDRRRIPTCGSSASPATPRPASRSAAPRPRR